MKKYCYLFTEGNAHMRELLGGKGANLAEMTNIGMPVPQGFTITTEACTQYYEDGRQINDEIMAQIVEYIGEHYDDPDFYMTSLADAFGISDKTIARAIKSYLHIGFSEYLEQLRLQKARLLLENPEMSVRMVAQESGFGSENTFYKAFRRIYKVSPSAYRANLEHLRDEKGEG